MFYMSYTTTYKGEIKTLKLTRDPFHHGLGHYTDTNGNVWDVHAIIGSMHSSSGRAYVNARQVGQHLDYYSTAANASTNGCHTWIPYYFEVVTENRAARRAR